MGGLDSYFALVAQEMENAKGREFMSKTFQFERYFSGEVANVKNLYCKIFQRLLGNVGPMTKFKRRNALVVDCS